MAKLDKGYRRAKSPGRITGGYGRYRSEDTELRETRKDKIADMHIRTLARGILDPLGLGDDADLRTTIEESLREDMAGKKMLKRDLIDAYKTAKSDGYAARLPNEQIKFDRAAEKLLDALYSATRMRERVDLEDGDLLDDVPSLVFDGEGWGEETAGRLEVKKHVNICIDDSGSTRMAETGFCSRAMVQAANNLINVLFTAASEYPGISWDAFSFNRVTEQHTGKYGQDRRYEILNRYLSMIVVVDPLKRDSVQTNLAPLMQQMYENEAERGLIGQPRIDIILTDGEFESKQDAEKAAEWQRQRGSGVTTYVLNLCPGEIEDPVPLPHMFRVIPVECLLEGTDGWSGKAVKKIDSAILTQVLNRIAVEEVSKL